MEFLGRKLLAGYEMPCAHNGILRGRKVSEFTVLSWNVFHGRDAPPDPALHRAAWHLSATPIDNGVHLQVNQSLAEQFADLIAAAQWSVCLLQEAPPAWAPMLGARCGAEVIRSLTSRNQLAFITRLIARWRPDLLGSWEGGSNMILTRPPWQMVEGSIRSILLSSLSERSLGERRRMSFVRLRPAGSGIRGICVANLHASAPGRAHAERELRRAAATATAWAGQTPLVFGGDFNLRPRSSKLFEELERDFQLRGATAPDAIDHLLSRGLEVVRPTSRWPPERRELEVSWRTGRRRIRLSDHAPIEAVLRPLPMRYK
jgi:endonuclease/exonuclease/phosphatase family metal-dependent hydrolase